MRATLDLYKSIIIFLRDELHILIKKTPGGPICFNLDDGELNYKFNQFIDCYKETRIAGEHNVGLTVEDSIEKYIDCINMALPLWESYDPSKMNRIRFLKTKEKLVQIFIGFAVGVVTSILGGLIVNNWTSVKELFLGLVN